MFRTILPLALLFSASSVLAAGTPGTVEYFVQNDVNGRPYAVGRVPNHPWPTRVTTPPFTFGTMTKPVGTTLLPSYAPQRMTAQSFARGMFNALVRRHPVVTAATVAWGIYECATAESGFCFGNGEPDENSCTDGGTFQDHPELGPICSEPAPSGELYSYQYGQKRSSPAKACENAAQNLFNSQKENNSNSTVRYTGSSGTLYEASPAYQYPGCRMTITMSVLVQDGTNSNWQTTQSTTTDPTISVWPSAPYCPPDNSPALISMYPVDHTNFICWSSAQPTEVEEVTPEALQDLIDRNPELFDTVPDDVLTDPTTGKPDDTFFDNPKHTPISRQLSDALRAIAAGLAQFTNPSAPHYYQPELKDKLEEALDKFHNGQPFVDPFTDSTVTPDPEPTEPPPYTPPAEITVKVEQSWDDFPGITQGQYEESNERWASDLAGRLPQEETDWVTFDDEFKDSISDNPDLPFEPFDFGVLWPITGGQCTGFSRTVSVAGTTKTIMFDRHCPPYNEWAHPFLAWFLQILAALQILTIFNRTMLSGAN